MIGHAELIYKLTNTEQPLSLVVGFIYEFKKYFFMPLVEEIALLSLGRKRLFIKHKPSVRTVRYLFFFFFSIRSPEFK